MGRWAEALVQQLGCRAPGTPRGQQSAKVRDLDSPGPGAASAGSWARTWGKERGALPRVWLPRRPAASKATLPEQLLGSRSAAGLGRWDGPGARLEHSWRGSTEADGGATTGNVHRCSHTPPQVWGRPRGYQWRAEADTGPAWTWPVTSCVPQGPARLKMESQVHQPGRLQCPLSVEKRPSPPPCERLPHALPQLDLSVPGVTSPRTRALESRKSTGQDPVK